MNGDSMPELRFIHSGGWYTALIAGLPELAGYGRTQADARASLLREIEARADRMAQEAEHLRGLLVELGNESGTADKRKIDPSEWASMGAWVTMTPYGYPRLSDGPDDDQDGAT